MIRKPAALDVAIRLNHGHISITLFRKPADGHQYVHWTSDHLRHLKVSLPLTQFLRIKRICPSAEDFEIVAVIIAKRFRAGGYPSWV